MVAWVTEGLIAPGVRAELGKTAPAVLTVMPPVWGAATALAVTGAIEGALVGLSVDVAALGEDVVGFGSAADGFGVEAPHPATMKTARVTVTAHKKCFPARHVMAAP